MWMLTGLWVALLFAGAVGLVGGYVIRRSCAQEKIRLVMPSAGLPLLPAPVYEASDLEQRLADREADIRRLQSWVENEQDQRLDAEQRVAEWMEAAAEAERERGRLLAERATLDAQLVAARFDQADTQRAGHKHAEALLQLDRAREEAEQARQESLALRARLQEAIAAREAQAARSLAQAQEVEASQTQTAQLQAAAQTQAQAALQAQAELRQMRQQVLALKEEHALQVSRRTREVAALAERVREAEAQGRSSAADELGLRDQLEELLVIRQAMAAELASVRAQAEAAQRALAEQARQPVPAPVPDEAAQARERALQSEILELRARLDVASAPSVSTRGHALDAEAATLLAAGQIERLVLAAGEGRRPAPAPDDRPGDDLRRIDGIGPANERWLHEIGVRHYAQIAAWTPEELAWVARHLPRFGQRVFRENWVAQSAALAGQGRVPQATPAEISA